MCLNSQLKFENYKRKNYHALFGIYSSLSVSMIPFRGHPLSHLSCSEWIIILKWCSV